MPMYTTLSRSSSIESDLEPLYSDGGARSHSRRFRNSLAAVFVATFVVVAVIAMVVAASSFSPPPLAPPPPAPASRPGTGGLGRAGQGRKGGPSEKLSPAVNTTCGPVRGVVEDQAYIFKGIPYGVPPLGPRRWKPPSSPEAEGRCWRNTYLATDYGPKCFQLNMLSRRQEGAEDCLYVNVWTPELGARSQLDVVVFIHGGGLMFMSGNEPGYMPTAKMAKETNMVYVSLNYRLNAFGFLALELLSWKSPSGTSGNYGFMDQILALQWVHHNIRAFGGNPNKVTLMGHSSGGTSVFALMGSPLARGLFHRAWIMSGSPVLNATLSQGEKDHMLFLNNTGCSRGRGQVLATYKCLYALSAEAVANAVPWDYWSSPHFYDLPLRGEKTFAIAIVDGYVLPKPPLEAMKAGIGSDVPLLISNMAQEIDVQPSPRDIESWKWRNYEIYVRSHLNTFGPNVSAEALYLYNHQVSPEYQFTTMVSDLRALCPADLQARSAARLLRSPVHRLIVTAAPSAPVRYNGFPKKHAFHAWDVIALFGDFRRLLDAPGRRDARLTRSLRRVLADLVRSGPTRRWRRYPEATGVVSAQIESARWYHATHCHFWVRSRLVPEYAWIN